MTPKGLAGQTDRCFLTRNLRGPDSLPACTDPKCVAPPSTARRFAPTHAPRSNRREPRVVVRPRSTTTTRWRAERGSLSGFYEQLVPLVRAINQKLPRERALRVLAADPPFDWDRFQTAEDLRQAVLSLRRDTSIASVIEKNVLAKHRKALMLMGTLHLLHGAGATGVIEEKHPSSIFVISELGVFGENSTDASKALLASWPIPAIARVKATSMGKLGLKSFLPPPPPLPPVVLEDSLRKRVDNRSTWLPPRS